MRLKFIKPSIERNRLAARLDRVDKMKAEHRAELAAKDAEIAKLRDDEHKSNVAYICDERARLRGLGAVDARRIRNLVLTAREEWRNAGQQGAFDAYLYFEKFKHELGLSAVGPTKGSATPIEAALPPLQHGKPPPGMPPAEAARRALETQNVYDRGQEYIERERREREAYKAALRKWGLEDPTLGGLHRGPLGGG